MIVRYATMDRDTVRDLSARITELLHALPDDARARVRGCRFDPAAGIATFKLEIALAGPNGQHATPESAALAAGGSYLAKFVLGMSTGTDATLVGRKFMSGGREFTLDGYKPRGRTTPFLATATENGKRYRFSVAAIRAALGVATG